MRIASYHSIGPSALSLGWLMGDDNKEGWLLYNTGLNIHCGLLSIRLSWGWDHAFSVEKWPWPWFYSLLTHLMNPLTSILHLVGSGAMAYLLASQIRDAKTRPNVLAGFQLAESGAVPFLTKLRDRAIAEGDPGLAEKLTRHANDERRHGQIFANGLKRLDKEVIDMKTLAQSNQADSGKQRSPFFEAYYRGYTQADLQPEVMDWQVFLASTYILEADACGDFRRMAQALTGVPEMEPIQAGILSVAEDEARHASYLREVMLQRYGFFTTESLIGEWRSRKVDALMAMVWNLVERGWAQRTMAQDRAPDGPSLDVVEPDPRDEAVAISVAA